MPVRPIDPKPPAPAATRVRKLKSLRLYKVDVAVVIGYLEERTASLKIKTGSAEIDSADDLPDLTQQQLDRLTIVTEEPKVAVSLHRNGPQISCSTGDKPAATLMDSTAGMLERDYRWPLARIRLPLIPMIGAVVFSAFAGGMWLWARSNGRSGSLSGLLAVLIASFVYLFLHTLSAGVKIVPISRAEGRARLSTIWISFGSAIVAAIITIVLMGVFEIY